MTRSRATADTQDNNGGSVAPFVAGKNRILNGDFSVNQRNFTSITGNQGYAIFDRFRQGSGGDGTVTTSAQTFTPGTAPVAGYEGRNFLQIQTTGQTTAAVNTIFEQRIESVRTFAGQTATISFWARATSGTPNIALEQIQNFGTGGSPSTAVTLTPITFTLSTTWTRYSATISIPSISGKTIGTNNDDYLRFQWWVSAGSDFNSRTNSLGIQTNTFQFWGVQLEAGSVATPFTTATGTIQGELAACQRYYWRIPGTNNIFYAGFNNSTTEAYSAIPLPVTMRVRPTTTVTSAATNLAVRISGGTNVACNGTTAIIGNTTQNIWFSTTVASGLTAGQGSALVNLGSSEAIEMSAEL